MFGIGAPEAIVSFIPLILLIVLFGGLSLSRRRGTIRISGPALALRKFKVDESLSEEIRVDIMGRASGIVGWFLTIIGFYGETNLRMTAKEISFSNKSRFGQIYQVVPVPCISSTHCGYSRSVGYLILAVLFIVIGVIMGFAPKGSAAAVVVLLILGGLFLIAYGFSKRIAISLETSGGMVLGLSFKRSVIENVPVDIEQALKAIHIVNGKVIESQTG